MTMTSSRPYLLRALREWIVDNQLTPHLMIDATMPGVSVPLQYVKDGKIVLNVTPEAIEDLSMANQWVNFQARFSGVIQQIRLPVMAITAIYAAENGRGMVFEHEPTDHDPEASSLGEKPSKKERGGRPNLKIIK